jgi:hypothetical protein
MNTAENTGTKTHGRRTLAKHVDLMNTAAKYGNKDTRQKNTFKMKKLLLSETQTSPCNTAHLQHDGTSRPDY